MKKTKTADVQNQRSETTPQFAKIMNKPNFDTWLRSVNLRHGGVHICSSKGYGKSVGLRHIARFYGSQPNTYVIIVDTLPNWCQKFDRVPYFTVLESDVREVSSNIEISEGFSYLTWAKRYYINDLPFKFLDRMLRQKQKIILFNIELEEIDLVGVFQAKIIDYLYQKQRIQKKYWKDNLPHQYIIISEETEAVFDTSLLDRKIMNRTRKQYSEMANLKIAMFSCSQRLTEVSRKFRSKMDSYLIGNSNIEDIDTRLTRILRFSKYREQLQKLPIGTFLDTKTDTLVSFPDFKPKGTPYEIKRETLIDKPKTEPQPKGFLTRLFDKIIQPKPQPQQTKTTNTDREDTEFFREVEEAEEEEEEELEEDLGLLGEPDEEW